MPVWILEIVKRLCIVLGVIVIFGFNIVNYFYAHKTLNDINLQWRIAMIGIAWVMFLAYVYAWINESIKRNNILIVITGWAALYLLFNLIGVTLGYHLHTRGFMMILFVTTAGAFAHISIRLWQNY